MDWMAQDFRMGAVVPAKKYNETEDKKGIFYFCSAIAAS